MAEPDEFPLTPEGGPAAGPAPSGVFAFATDPGAEEALREGLADLSSPKNKAQRYGSLTMVMQLKSQQITFIWDCYIYVLPSGLHTALQ